MLSICFWCSFCIRFYKTNDFIVSFIISLIRGQVVKNLFYQEFLTCSDYLTGHIEPSRNCSGGLKSADVCTPEVLIKIILLMLRKFILYIPR